MSNVLPQPGHFFCPPVVGVGGVPVTEKLELDLSNIPVDKHSAVLKAFHESYPALQPSKEKSTAK